ncbi:MAG: hypothetical protein KF868_15735 [Acidobacteria bacterium]|nr:hypothetical protein [Acidobacteriota bacterium]MCW5967513.1 hypothetical protein [Blastocatellales bacterium]
MSVYDTRDLMDFRGAAREYGVPASQLELAVKQGALRAIEIDGQPKLLRFDVENLAKRIVKRGYGNRVVSPIARPSTGD